MQAATDKKKLEDVNHGCLDAERCKVAQEKTTRLLLPIRLQGTASLSYSSSERVQEGEEVGATTMTQVKLECGMWVRDETQD